ncbi:MAG: hypothetical protein JXR44_02695 [Thiotrichales bacterium]|nr:hypothetical protein [Thiotrichales bacterium]
MQSRLAFLYLSRVLLLLVVLGAQALGLWHAYATDHSEHQHTIACHALDQAAEPRIILPSLLFPQPFGLAPFVIDFAATAWQNLTFFWWYQGRAPPICCFP